MTTKNNSNETMTLEEYTEICREIDEQPTWREIADKEMDYADGNQIDGELVQRQKQLGIPPAIENLIGPALLSIQGFEAKTRTDWRVTEDVAGENAEVAEALNFKLNQAERHSKADNACTDAFRSQIGAGIAFVEVSRESDPFKYPYRCVSVHRNEIAWDMKAKEHDLSDGRWMRRKRWMPYERAKLNFPQYAALIDACAGSWSAYLADGSTDGEISTNLYKSWSDQRGSTIEEQLWHDPARKMVCLVELWYRYWCQATILKSPDGRVVEYDADNRAHNVALATGMSKVSKAVIAKLRRAYWLGPHLLDDSPTPYTHRQFPYVPFWCFKEDRTGVPFGFVRAMIYQQDALNSGISKMRWGMSSVRTERTKGAVAMSDAVFRKMIARVDADIVLDAEHMAKAGSRFEVMRDFQMNEQQYKMLNDARAAIERVSAVTAGFSGRSGSATSGRQEDTQVEQSNQTLASVMDSFKRGRAMIGDMLLSFITEDIGKEPQQVLIPSTEVKEERVIGLNQPQEDAEMGYEYLTNDVQRTRLKVALEDVPSTSSYRGQQLNAMSEAVKSLPPEYQAAALPFMVSLMDVPNKKQIIESIKAVKQQQTPEAIQQQIEQGIKDGIVKAGLDLKARELELKYSPEKLRAEVAKIVSETVGAGVTTTFAAMQAAEKIAMNPGIAPVGDIVMKQAGWQPPNPAGQDPNIPIVEQAVPVQGAGGVPGDTSPLTPQMPNGANIGANQGIETLRQD